MSKPYKKKHNSGSGMAARQSTPQESVTSRSLWFSGPRTIEIREKQVRPPGEGEAQIRAICSGISHGTEMLVYRGEAPSDLPLDLRIPAMEGSFAFPIKYGYASVGRVTGLGRNVEGLSEGDTVFAFNPHETVYNISSRFVIKLPCEVDARTGVFFANVETAINVVLDAAPRIGERVAIFGQGAVGLMITWLGRRTGAELIVACDPFEKRRDVSSALGADFTIDPQAESPSARIRELTGGAGADVVIEASGRPEALDEAIRATAREGRVIVVSWYGAKQTPLALGDAFHRNRITIKSSQVSNIDPSIEPRWTRERRRELALKYLSEIPANRLITHKFAFEGAAAAYRLVDEHPEETVQAILEYD